MTPASGHRAPTRADHERFCEREGWTLVRDARGRNVSHHQTFELALPDGRILRTRISQPPDRSGYGAGMFAHILRDQLHVSVDEFWACVRDGVLPSRGVPGRTTEALPASVVWQLVRRYGVPEAEVAAMTKEQALQALEHFWHKE